MDQLIVIISHQLLGLEHGLHDYNTQYIYTSY
jgi:hypothetical protein